MSFTVGCRHAFEVGDRIRIVEDIPRTNLAAGDEAEVIWTSVFCRDIGIMLDRIDTNKFHSCDGRCEDGRGWYVFSNEIERGYIELITYDEIENVSSDELLEMLEVNYV